MADLVQTPANVSQYTNVAGQVIPGVAGEAINAGMPCYQTNDTSGTNVGRWFKASSANALTAGSFAPVRISLASAPGAGQPLQLMGAGLINLGATLSVGETYVVSNTAGAIKPFGDLLTNEFTCVLGFATNAAAMLSPGSSSSNTARATNA